jgi:hypothetical protein
VGTELSGRRRVWRYRIRLTAAIATVSALGAVAVLTSAAPAGAAPPLTTVNQQEAVATYQALQQQLYVPLLSVYKGLPTGSCGSYSCLWPFTNAMAGTAFLFGMPSGSKYAPDLVARHVGLADYANLLERSPSGTIQPAAFQSAVAAPLGPGGSTYYDDNGWVGLNLIHAYRLTINPADLMLAQNSFNFAVSGWDTSLTDGCPGGVFWQDVAGSQRNTTANAANAELGVELYLLTGNSKDLSWATRMYQWVVTCLGTPGGLYNDHVNPGGSVNTTIWSYNQGTMVGAGTLLYKATGTAAYLTQAEHTASAAVSFLGIGSTLVNQGPAFNAIYFRDLFVLGQIAGNAPFANEAQTYATYMWTQRQPTTGLIDPQFGVNGTAAMVEIYSLLAGSAPSP